MNELTEVRIVVNGREVRKEVESGVTLLEFLREGLELSGTKRGCDGGHCGACTVLLDGEAVNSCILLAIQADGKEVSTIEGFSDGGELHPLQEAFIETNAVQCGFCTPGMIVSAKGLLDRKPDASEREIKEALSGNLCRCTGYAKIIQAVTRAQRVLKGRA